MKTVHLLIKTRPERAAAVRAHLACLHGVKVHAITFDNRVFATIGRENEGELAREIENLNQSPDVLDTMAVDEKEVTFDGAK